MKTLKLNEYIQQNLNQSKQYREIFNDFGIAFEQYVELLHKGNPMAEQFYLKALKVFSERLNKYAADYADKLVLEDKFNK